MQTILSINKMNINNLHQQQENIPAISNQQTQQRKRCHGNRRDQRFRRKCRNEKMQPTKIEKLIKKRNRLHKKHQKNISTTHHTTNVNTIRQNNHSQPFITTATNNNNNKRKRHVSQQEHLYKNHNNRFNIYPTTIIEKDETYNTYNG